MTSNTHIACALRRGSTVPVLPYGMQWKQGSTLHAQQHANTVCLMLGWEN